MITVSHIARFYFFKYFIYSLEYTERKVIKRERETETETQAEGEAGSMQGVRRGT